MADNSGEPSTTREKLPQDLIMDILSRLPAPYLWPLRSVSKSWFRLIAKDPQFAKSIFDKSVQSKSNPSFIIALVEKKEEEKGKLDFYMATDHTECDKAIKLKQDGEICFLDKHVTLGRPEVVGDFTVLVPLGVVAWSGDILVLKNQRELITYNLSTKSINPLKEFCCPIVNAFPFTGSIISPRAINGAGQI